MARVTIGFGIWLIVVGVAAYLLSPSLTGNPPSPTALIPAGAGAVMAVLGVFARMEGPVRAIVSHLSVLVAVALVVMCASGVGEFLAMFEGNVHSPISVAPLPKMIVAASGVAYIYLAVRSFMAARAARREGEKPSFPKPEPGRPNLPKRPGAVQTK